MVEIKLIQDRESRNLILDPEKTYVQNLFARGWLKGVPLCSGMGLCAQCAMIFQENAPQPAARDRTCFDRNELAQGLRLGCAHYPRPGQVVKVRFESLAEDFSRTSVSRVKYAGIDLGTTAIKWGFVHADSKLSNGRLINPQMGAGPDIMSRLAFAAESFDQACLLSRMAWDEVHRILDMAGDQVQGICLAGNPAMIYLLLNLNTAKIRSWPYALNYKGGTWLLPVRGGQEIFVPVLFSPFVGADLSAGLSYILSRPELEFPFLFMDFGTNGELILGLSRDRFLSTSVAMGPALEGVGLRFGSPFKKGAASGFALSAQGLVPRDEWTGTRVSGSGYLSLLAHLVRLGVVTRQGSFAPGATPLSRKIFAKVRDKSLFPGSAFYLQPLDIEEILKVKAAFTTGFNYLCARGGISPGELTAFYVAGSLGEHIQPQDLETLGFIPQGSMSKCRIMGNTSLAGALMLARDEDLRRKNLKLETRVENFNPALEDKDYMTGFTGQMRFEFQKLNRPGPA
ncbi:MAG: ASKHA domain-containing protein [Desulfonatronovibrionaceae bacterium]